MNTEDNIRTVFDPNIESEVVEETTTVETFEHIPMAEWHLSRDEYMRLAGLEYAVKFAGAISTPEAAMSVEQMKEIADEFVDYIKGEPDGQG